MKRLVTDPERLYRKAFHELRDLAVILLDTQGVIAGWNAGAERIFGYPERDIVGQHFALLFLPEERERGVHDMELAKARETGRAEDVRWHLRRDGSRVFADGLTLAIYEDDQRLIGFVKVTRDVTSRWLTENRLVTQLAVANLLTEDKPLDDTSRDLMQSICTNLGWDIGGLWMVEDGKLVLRCMDVWQSGVLSGDEVRQLCDLSLTRGIGLPGRVWQSEEPAWIIDLETDPNFPRAAIAARLGIKSGFAFPLIHENQVLGVMEFFSREPREPDQSLLPIMALIGARVGEYFVRRRTAEALRASEERYRVITETAQGVILTLTTDSTIIFANPAAEQVLGYKPEELIGRKLDVIIPQRFRSGHYAGMARYLMTGERRINWHGTELIARHKDGREIPVLVSFGDWRSGEQRIFTGFVYDISERKQMEFEREQLLQDAQAANRSKDFFLATISHELRTPLTSILGWTRILQNESCDGETLRAALESIENSAVMQSKLVNDLVDFSRILSGKLRLEDRPVELGQVVAAAVQSLSPQADAKRITINVRSPLEVQTHGDPERLQQVVSNLLSNALKFSAEGQSVDVVIRSIGHFAEIEVRDYGEGISAEHLPLLFQPFQQVVEGKHGGLGLGLAIVKEIVERHGGSVSVSSPGRGGGATFTVKLPIRKSAEAPVAAA